MVKATSLLQGDERYQTNFATKPEANESEEGDPMELMVELPGGGYEMSRYVQKKQGVYVSQYRPDSSMVKGESRMKGYNRSNHQSQQSFATAS